MAKETGTGFFEDFVKINKEFKETNKRLDDLEEVVIDAVASMKSRKELPKGDKGDPGASAYQTWLDLGNKGSEKDFLKFLKGKQEVITKTIVEERPVTVRETRVIEKEPLEGKSAYEIWLQQGNEGNEVDFLESLRGEDGKMLVREIHTRTVGGGGGSILKAGEIGRLDLVGTADNDDELPLVRAGSLLKIRRSDLIAGGAGTGDVVGPASSTDNAVARYDGTTGKIIQNSGVLIDDSNNLSTSGTLGGSNLSGTNSGDQNLFGTIAVSGQDNIVADTTSDTLTIAEGSNITLTTNAGTDTLTIAASGGGDVTGPASSNDNALARFDGTGGKTIQNSGATLSDAGVITATFSGNLTGNVTGNADTVTTNANLTGPITSVGNATSIAAQTGTGTTFVVQTSPTLTTPNIGAATLGGAMNCNGNNITDVHELRLDATPDTDHTANGPTTNTLNAGTTIAIGELLYLATDGEWALADADAESTASGMLAVALAAGTDNNPLLVALPGSFVRDDTYNFTIGDVLYVSTTAGGITATAPSATGDVVRVVGYAVSADIIYFNPGATWVEVA